MVIDISDAMFVRLVELANAQTCDEANEDHFPDYDDGVQDGKIFLARTFLDEAVIIHD